MTPSVILWIYLGLLVVGGFMGYLKAGSKVSLISALVSAVLLAVAELWLSKPATEVILGLLVAMFLWRLIKTKKFMPSGLMLILTVVALGLRLLVK